MKDQNPVLGGYYSEGDCELAEFDALISQEQRPEDVPRASGIIRNVPIYDCQALSDTFDNPVARCSLMAEWAQILGHGAGVFVLKHAQPDHSAIDAATAVYDQIIAEEKAHGAQSADHFATAGANDRVWNSLQKLCLTAPEVFCRYFAAPAIDAACEAWLGPNYQMTAQINLVRPGGAAQQAHRDYHLGFQTAELSARYPAHTHDLSPLLTLQGGIAHCDIPVISGPTKLLPFSQLYRPGYAAWRRADFRARFEECCIQVPLDKGDALFFSPALFHAAGENKSKGIQRMVNLLQVSSAFGRAMESIDRSAMTRAVLAPLRSLFPSPTPEDPRLRAVISATAEGYSFPTNLDRDPPIGGLAPKTQADVLRDAVLSARDITELDAQLRALDLRRTP